MTCGYLCLEFLVDVVATVHVVVVVVVVVVDAAKK